MRKHHKLKQPSLMITWCTDSHMRADIDGDPNQPRSKGVGGNATRWYYTAGSKLTKFRNKTNELQPALAIHTGDIVDHSNDFSLFNSIWNEINVPTALTVGNHDFDSNDYESIKSALGYETEIAGSVFNQSFAINQNGVSARIVIVDTNIDPADGHKPLIAGRMSEDLRNWIKAELESAIEDVAIVFMHHGVNNRDIGFFNSSEAIAYENMITSISNIRVHTLSGHHHILDRRIINGAYNGAAIVENVTSTAHVVNVFANGDLEIDSFSV